MNRRQRESLAKFFYVIAQITFGGLVIGTLSQGGTNTILRVSSGVILTFLEVMTALSLESGAVQRR